MATNDFLVFGGGVGANVMLQSDYLNLGARVSGFQSGTALSIQLNKVWRQSSIMSSMLGQFIADRSGANAIDDGTTATLEANFIAAIQAVTRVKVSSPGLTIYVNPASGNDTNTGLSPTSAKQTIQSAANALYTGYDHNNFPCTIQLANGTYTSGVQIYGLPLGASAVNITGNAASPSSVVISTTNGNCIVYVVGAFGTVNGVTMQSTGTPVGFTPRGYGLLAQAAYVQGLNLSFGSCGVSQMAVSASGFISVAGGAVTFAGTSPFGVAVESGVINMVGTAITLNSAVYTSAFAQAAYDGEIRVDSANVVTGSATGKKYNIIGTASISVGGGGTSFLPGSIAGTNNGGFYG